MKGCGTRALHRCAAEGCKVGVGYGLLMCGPHWRQVPADLQQRVYDTLRAYKERAKRGDELVGSEEHRAYYAARAEAIAAVPTPADPLRCDCGERLQVSLCGVTDLAAALAGVVEDAALLGCELRVSGDRVLGFTCSKCLAARRSS